LETRDFSTSQKLSRRSLMPARIVMATVFCDSEGIVLVNLEHGSTVTETYYKMSNLNS